MPTRNGTQNVLARAGLNGTYSQFGKPRPNDPTRPVTTLKTAWQNLRKKAKVTGRWHDNRHTLVTELAESGAGDEVIISIAGHVSRAMLSRYSAMAKLLYSSRQRLRLPQFQEMATTKNRAVHKISLARSFCLKTRLSL